MLIQLSGIISIKPSNILCIQNYSFMEHNFHKTFSFQMPNTYSYFQFPFCQPSAPFLYYPTNPTFNYILSYAPNEIELEKPKNTEVTNTVSEKNRDFSNVKYQSTAYQADQNKSLGQNRLQSVEEAEKYFDPNKAPLLTSDSIIGLNLNENYQIQSGQSIFKKFQSLQQQCLQNKKCYIISDNDNNIQIEQLQTKKSEKTNNSSQKKSQYIQSPIISPNDNPFIIIKATKQRKQCKIATNKLKKIRLPKRLKQQQLKLQAIAQKPQNPFKIQRMKKQKCRKATQKQQFKWLQNLLKPKSKINDLLVESHAEIPALMNLKERNTCSFLDFIEKKKQSLAARELNTTFFGCSWNGKEKIQTVNKN